MGYHGPPHQWPRHEAGASSNPTAWATPSQNRSQRRSTSLSPSLILKDHADMERTSQLLSLKRPSPS